MFDHAHMWYRKGTPSPAHGSNKLLHYHQQKLLSFEIKKLALKQNIALNWNFYGADNNLNSSVLLTDSNPFEIMAVKMQRSRLEA